MHITEKLQNAYSLQNVSNSDSYFFVEWLWDVYKMKELLWKNRYSITQMSMLVIRCSVRNITKSVSFFTSASEWLLGMQTYSYKIEKSYKSNRYSIHGWVSFSKIPHFQTPPIQSFFAFLDLDNSMTKRWLENENISVKEFYSNAQMIMHIKGILHVK